MELKHIRISMSEDILFPYLVGKLDAVTLYFWRSRCSPYSSRGAMFPGDTIKIAEVDLEESRLGNFNWKVMGSY